MPSRPKAKAKAKAKAKPTSVAGYLAAVRADQRAALERLRKTIRAEVPGVEEAISYGMPGFRLNGKWLLWIGAAANHCSVYGLGGSTPELKKELKDFDTSGRGTIRFQPDAPLPVGLMRKLLRERVAKNAAGDRKPRATRRS